MCMKVGSFYSRLEVSTSYPSSPLTFHPSLSQDRGKVQSLATFPWLLGHHFHLLRYFNRLYNPWGLITAHPHHLCYPIHTYTILQSPIVAPIIAYTMISPACTQEPPQPSSHVDTIVDAIANIASEKLSAPTTSESSFLHVIFTMRSFVDEFIMYHEWN